MSDLGITKEYVDAMKKIKFGKYLKNISGDSPTDMINPYAHHILFKTGNGPAQQALVEEGQNILRKYGIDPVVGPENLIWAPNAVTGQHSVEVLENVAADCGKLDIAEYLIENGLDVNKNGGISGGNPIRSAARNGNLDIVQLLYEKGAIFDVSEATKNPLFGAICNGHYEVAKYLIDSGIDITAKYPIEKLKNVDAYEYARQFGQTEIANYLKERM